jgi:arginase
MPLAVIAGLAESRWREAAGLTVPVAPERILLAGVRELDPEEERLLHATAITVIPCDGLRASDAFAQEVALLAGRCQTLALVVDLDVLDPSLVPSATTPVEHGLDISEAAAAIGTVLSTGKVACVCLSSLNPGGGSRGQTSMHTALELLEQALPAWKTVPPAPATG